MAFTFEQLLAQYPRLAITGAPRTGKTTFTMQVKDRPVIHTDDWMDWPWAQVPELVGVACSQHEQFVVEGVQVPRTLRKGLVEVDAVLYLTEPKTEQTPAQRAMGAGVVHKVLDEWAQEHPEIPIVTEEQLSLPTLDKADIPLHTRRYAISTIDRGAIGERTSQGFLRIPARFSKAGVFQYNRGGRILREYRPAEELRKPEAIASLKTSLPVVLHPSENGGAVDPTNAKRLTVGHVEDVRFNDETRALEGILVITDGPTIDRIEAGELADISCGYDNGRKLTPGFTENREPFDLIQVDYQFNHVALGPPGWGRQGQDVGLSLDADDNQLAAPPPTEEPPMDPKKKAAEAAAKEPKTKTADEGVQQELPGAAASQGAPPAGGEQKPPESKDEALSPEDVSALKELVSMVPVLRKLVNTGNPEAKPPAPTTEDEGQPATEQKTMDAAEVEKLVQEGSEVRADAARVLGEKYSTKNKSTREIRIDVIRTMDDKFDGKDKSDETIRTSYDLALKHSEHVAQQNSQSELARIRFKQSTADAGDRKPTLDDKINSAWQAQS